MIYKSMSVKVYWSQFKTAVQHQLCFLYCVKWSYLGFVWLNEDLARFVSPNVDDYCFCQLPASLNWLRFVTRLWLQRSHPEPNYPFFQFWHIHSIFTVITEKGNLTHAIRCADKPDKITLYNIRTRWTWGGEVSKTCITSTSLCQARSMLFWQGSHIKPYECRREINKDTWKLNSWKSFTWI